MPGWPACSCTMVSGYNNRLRHWHRLEPSAIIAFRHCSDISITWRAALTPQRFASSRGVYGQPLPFYNDLPKKKKSENSASGSHLHCEHWCAFIFAEPFCFLTRWSFAWLMMALTPKRLFFSLSLLFYLSSPPFLALTFGQYILFKNACELQRVVLRLEEFATKLSMTLPWIGTNMLQVWKLQLRVYISQTYQTVCSPYSNRWRRACSPTHNLTLHVKEFQATVWRCFAKWN